MLYVDIDIHHGDGVEEAFYTTDRVMTVRSGWGGGSTAGLVAYRDVFYTTDRVMRGGLEGIWSECVG